MAGMIRNRVIEEDVRDYLNQEGYLRGSIRFAYMELVAIQRPGWAQVFKFCAHAKNDRGDVRKLVGVARDDERSSLQVFIGDGVDDQSRKADEWSEGLITSTRRPLGSAQRFLLGVVVLILVATFVSAVLTTGQ